jgi:hypothetical protein
MRKPIMMSAPPRTPLHCTFPPLVKLIPSLIRSVCSFSLFARLSQGKAMHCQAHASSNKPNKEFFNRLEGF